MMAPAEVQTFFGFLSMTQSGVNPFNSPQNVSIDLT